MKTIFRYLAIAITGISAVTTVQSFGAENKTSVANTSEFSEVVVLSPKEIKTIDKIRPVQEEYIRKHYEGYQIIFNMYTKDSKGCPIEIFALENDENKAAYVTFDMSQVYKKLKVKNKETREKVELLEKKH